MKIAHLSDLHIGISNYHNEKIEKIIKSISEQNVEHLVITGDLTNSGSPEEFEKIVEILCRYSFYSAERLTVIPGNHDLYSPFFREFLSFRTVYRSVKKIIAFLRFHFLYTKKKYLNDVNTFNSYFKETFKSAAVDGINRGGYPFVKILNDKVALIGIDSNSLPSFIKNPGCSTGEITRKAFKALNQIFINPQVKNKIKIVLIHHYLHPTDTFIGKRKFFRFIQLYNREELVELFDKYEVNLVLHGHFHVSNKYWLVDHKVMVLNGGATANGGWHLIHIDGDKITIN